MCTYGIEILADNIAECRANMLEVFAGYLNLNETAELALQDGNKKISASARRLQETRVYARSVSPFTRSSMFSTNH
jgi:hypothetical protein